MKLSDEEIKGIVAEATGNLRLELANKLKSSIEYQVEQTANRLVASHVEEWIKEHVLPDVTALLVEGKASLVSAAGSMGEEMGRMMAEGFKVTLQDKMKEGYHRRKIFEALLG